MEDIEAVEVFRVEVETPRMGTGFALIRKYVIYFGGCRDRVGGFIGDLGTFYFPPSGHVEI